MVSEGRQEQIMAEAEELRSSLRLCWWARISAFEACGGCTGGWVESLPRGVQWCGRRATHACRKGNVRHLSAQPEDALST